MEGQAYTDAKILLELPRKDGVIRLMVCHKTVKGEERTYIDLRSWQQTFPGAMTPGKGFSRAMNPGEIKLLAEALAKYEEED